MRDRGEATWDSYQGLNAAYRDYDRRQAAVNAVIEFVGAGVPTDLVKLRRPVPPTPLPDEEEGPLPFPAPRTKTGWRDEARKPFSVE